jgi:hypothetical protein
VARRFGWAAAAAAASWRVAKPKSNALHNNTPASSRAASCVAPSCAEERCREMGCAKARLSERPSLIEVCGGAPALCVDSTPVLLTCEAARRANLSPLRGVCVSSSPLFKSTTPSISTQCISTTAQPFKHFTDCLVFRAACAYREPSVVRREGIAQHLSFALAVRESAHAASTWQLSTTPVS